ncbi:TIGR03067 domain-containing protein [Fimbriiglobus ruber]|uniref:Lipocalin-like domain-containing protein n=1 Tax=Fimbriiglobus ruber TaxID=1908690 RepID=A0A225E8A1_9BACT|nr:TIGR03067 domain-containing protein [Fimbriiglobus ruber]OWK46998.1 hypothetical protein FRUB_00697 [Fimbriiglobus ruber]
MKAKLSLLIVCALGFTFVGCKKPEEVAAEKAAVEGELKKLEGTWKIASREGKAEDEDDADADSANKYVISIKGDILEEKIGDDVIGRRKLTILPNKTPAQVDLTWVDEAGKPITSTSTKKNRKGKKTTKTETLKQVAIYSIEGDKLKFCFSWDDKTRPTDFTAPPGSNRYTWTLARVKGTEEKVTDEKKDDKTPATTKSEDKTPATAKAITPATAKSDDKTPATAKAITPATSKSDDKATVPSTAPTVKTVPTAVTKPNDK